MATSLGNASFIGLVWMATSAVFSTYANGLFLRFFNDAVAHTFFRFALSSLLGIIYFVATGNQLLFKVQQVIGRLALPAVLLLIANLLNSMSMLSSGVTCAYVVKSLIPFFTVLISCSRGQRFESAVYISLCPVCAGVCVASLTDLDFSVSGLLFALGSALSQTMLNITSKERIKELQLSGMEAFTIMASICAVLSLPLFALSCTRSDGFLDRWALSRSPTSGDPSIEHFNPAAQVVVIAAVAYHVEYTLNFLFVALCSPLAFSLCDILRRLGTICCGAIIFAKPFTLLNATGVLTSLLGVLAYSYTVIRSPTSTSSKLSLDTVGANACKEHWVAHYPRTMGSPSKMAALRNCSQSDLLACDSSLGISSASLHAGGSVFPVRFTRSISEGAAHLEIDEDALLEMESLLGMTRCISGP